MKKNDKQKLHQSTVVELTKKLDSLHSDLVKHRNERALGKVSNLKTGKNIRLEIAVINTILTEKELANKSETTS